MTKPLAALALMLFFIAPGLANAAKLSKKNLTGTWNGHIEVSMSGQQMQVAVEMAFTATGEMKATAKLGDKEETTEGKYAIREGMLVLFAGNEKDEARVKNIEFTGQTLAGDVVPRKGEMPEGASIKLNLTKH